MKDFEKLLIQVEKHGRYKSISFKNKNVNWVVSRIGWVNLCNITKDSYNHYLERFICLMELAKENNKKLDNCNSCDDYSTFERVVI